MRSGSCGKTEKGGIGTICRRVVRRSNGGVEKWLKSTQNLTVYEGHARFEAHVSIEALFVI